MENNSNSLYGSLCQLFLSVSNSKYSIHVKKNREFSPRKQSIDLQAKNIVKRNAFKLLYSYTEAEEWTNRSQVYAHIFELKNQGFHFYKIMLFIVK